MKGKVTHGWKMLLKVKGRGIRSIMGYQGWKLKTWYSVMGPIELCNNGFHMSPTPWEAWSIVHGGNVVAYVAAKGTKRSKAVYHRKSAHRSMRIVRAYSWTVSDAKAFYRFINGREPKSQEQKMTWFKARIAKKTPLKS